MQIYIEIDYGQTIFLSHYVYYIYTHTQTDTDEHMHEPPDSEMNAYITLNRKENGKRKEHQCGRNCTRQNEIPVHNAGWDSGIPD